jgi:hypothetical protein
MSGVSLPGLVLLGACLLAAAVPVVMVLRPDALARRWEDRYPHANVSRAALRVIGVCALGALLVVGWQVYAAGRAHDRFTDRLAAEQTVQEAKEAFAERLGVDVLWQPPAEVVADDAGITGNAPIVAHAAHGTTLLLTYRHDPICSSTVAVVESPGRITVTIADERAAVRAAPGQRPDTTCAPTEGPRAFGMVLELDDAVGAREVVDGATGAPAA